MPLEPPVTYRVTSGFIVQPAGIRHANGRALSRGKNSHSSTSSLLSINSSQYKQLVTFMHWGHGPGCV